MFIVFYTLSPSNTSKEIDVSPTQIVEVSIDMAKGSCTERYCSWPKKKKEAVLSKRKGKKGKYYSLYTTSCNLSSAVQVPSASWLHWKPET